MTISSLPPSLFPLGRNGTTDRVSKAIADAGPTPSWYCPAVSPHSAGLVCPVFLYGAKTVPPTRAERQQKSVSRRRRHVVGSGPNYRRSRRRLSLRNPPGVHPGRAIFKQSRHARRLNLWAFPSPDGSAHNAIETDEDTISNWDSSTFHFDRDDNEPHTGRTDDITDGTISWHSQSTRQIPPQNVSSTRPSAAIRRLVTSSKPLSKQGYIISNIFTQNAHGLRRRARDEHENLRPNSPHDYTRYEHLNTSSQP